jgi:hypothetical protein
MRHGGVAAAALDPDGEFGGRRHDRRRDGWRTRRPAGPACCACRRPPMPKRSIMPSLTISLPPPPPSSAGWKITATEPAKFRVSARYFAAPSSMAVCPSWPQACILPGVFEPWLAVDLRSSAARPCRRAGRRRPSPLRPRMMPTTPVRPMPVTTSSTPNSFSFGHECRRLDARRNSAPASCAVPAPSGDFVLHFGGAVQNRHGSISCFSSCGKGQTCSPALPC